MTGWPGSTLESAEAWWHRCKLLGMPLSLYGSDQKIFYLHMKNTTRAVKKMCFKRNPPSLCMQSSHLPGTKKRNLPSPQGTALAVYSAFKPSNLVSWRVTSNLGTKKVTKGQIGTWEWTVQLYHVPVLKFEMVGGHHVELTMQATGRTNRSRLHIAAIFCCRDESSEGYKWSLSDCYSWVWKLFVPRIQENCGHCMQILFAASPWHPPKFPEAVSVICLPKKCSRSSWKLFS